MNFKKHPKHLLAIAIFSAGGMAGTAPSAFAQEAVEEVVVTGLRGRPRTVTDAPVAIDSFSSETIEAVSFVETGDVLQSLVPSFQNPRSPISDGATFVRQFSLRGLAPQYSLVLVNGKRRHRSAMLSPGSGNQGPDVATIPTAAIGSIEVLRDGASSQYGSDAIAGVINFNLKENTEGFTLTYDTGQQYEGDGFQSTVQANAGFALGESGFVSISAEYSDVEFVERNGQYCGGTNPCIDPSRPEFDPNSTIGQRVLTPEFQAGLPLASVEGDTVQPWGQPNNEALRLFVNTGYTLDNGAEFYGFANFGESLGDGSFNYRHPGVGNVRRDRRLTDGSVWGVTNNQGTGPNFAAGYTPRFEGRVTDYSAAGGLRGQTDGGLNWDVSARFGSSEIEYRLFNTWNPSFGPLSPTDMDVGDQINQETQFQADFSKEFDFDGLASPVVVAFGASYLDESFEIVEAQDNPSFLPGPWFEADPFDFCTGSAPSLSGQAVIANGSTLNCADSSDPVFTSWGVGSDGFPGFGPAAASVNSRDSYAGYLDVSADVTDKLLLQAAVRYEDYSDFGDALVGKVAARYYITDQFAIRGSAGTGFRAPTPGQQFTTNIRTILPFGAPINVGLFPPTNAAAAALGALPLDAEDTVNYTLGFTADIAGVTLTVDAYQIEIEGRVNSVSNRPVSTDPANAAGFANFQLLVANNVPNPESLGELNWYANTFDTVNRGIDIVATYDADWGNGHTTDFSFAYNMNEQELEGNVSQFFAPFSQFNFEEGPLQSNAIVTAMHRYQDWMFTARGRYFGEYSQAQRPGAGVSIDGSVFESQTFDPELYIDFEGQYQFNERLRFTLGARNIFDEYPDEITLNQSATRGRIYNSGSLVPWAGGYYYGRVDFSL
jgi:iron complex outermembrane receptor protein